MLDLAGLLSLALLVLDLAGLLSLALLVLDLCLQDKLPHKRRREAFLRAPEHHPDFYAPPYAYDKHICIYFFPHPPPALRGFSLILVGTIGGKNGGPITTVF